ncbi:hypothetical protein SAMN04515665_104131 [Blastococcus sp. DSM 46786]|uniref:hypothetical protein n=1 Tax=Blastococcus sp. DSM 46786 TaxID=1798227 RepID=UPI0008AB32C0|nr:hypothetical protein [Blastococcus sp. DSM 46786]SEK69616.1 hypothetical protein SAMN04515665_104131 [Blastococcus sp. DSM 46786]
MTPPVRTSTGALGRALRIALVVLAVVAVVAVMVRLSVWQWDRGRARGSLLNYSYAIEWLAFAVLTVVGVVRLWREGRSVAEQDAPPEPGTGGPLVGPPLQPGQELEELTWVRLRRRLGLSRD